MSILNMVAAMVLRVGRDEKTRPLTWAELGEALEITMDQARHRLNSFKKKYNVVDSDAKVAGWARTFLAENTPEAEKYLLEDAAFYPGEVVKYDGDYAVVREVDEDELYTVVWFDDDGFYVAEYLDAEDLESVDALPVAVTKAKFAQPTAKPAANPIASIAQGMGGGSKKAPIQDLQHLITPNCLIVVRDGKPLTIDKSHKNFDKIEAALKAKQWQQVLDLIDLKNTLTKYSNGRVVVENGEVQLDGEKMHGKAVDRLLDCLMEENTESLEALANFVMKCDDNPDHRVVTRIYDFIAAKDIRLAADGDFYAYKVVRSDYNDKHSNTMSNKPGLTVKMKRNQVNPNDAQTCSFGLHVCSKSYIQHFSGNGDRVVLCKVNPRDVVSVPNDYGDAKMRTCEYIVVKDVTENFVSEETGLKPRG